MYLSSLNHALRSLQAATTLPFCRFSRLFLPLACLLWLSTQGAFAQKKPHPDSVAMLNRQTLRYCLAPNLSNPEQLRLDKAAKLALQIKRASFNSGTGVSWVPVRAHILRRSNGTGDFNLARLNRVIALTNRYFLNNGTGIQFYLAGSAPDYIDNDALYQTFPYGNESSISGRDATNAMNVYFVNNFSLSGLQGYAYFPDNDIVTTRSFIRSDVSMTDEFLGSILIPHEWGHNFGLFHTFQGSTEMNSELVTRDAGANCTTAGDLLCDTPADPYNRPGATYSIVNGCPVYTGTATDTWGATYAPSMDNIMSYYDGCNPLFTVGQYDRIQAALALRQSHTAYSLTHSPTAVAAPSRLQATLGTSGHASLTWQDNASNEMGYIIERATNSAGPFVPIGGTAPNGTFFTDTKTTTSATYYYRVRPSNTTDGAISAVATYAAGTTAAACTPTLSLGCVLNDGLDDLFMNGATLNRQSGCSANGYHEFTPASATVTAEQVCRFSGRLLSSSQASNVTIYIDYNRDGTYAASELVMSQYAVGTFAGQVELPAQLSSGPLPVRVIVSRYSSTPTSCFSETYGETEDYTLMVVPATCALPGSLSATVQTPTVQLNWSGGSGATSHDLRWKQQTASVWTDVAGLTGNSYTLTNLPANTDYQWQVRSVCSAGASVWTGMLFSTVCQPPTTLPATNATTTSIQLNWSSLGSGATYELWWRPEGASSWLTLQGLTTNAYTITGLQPGRTYQWQVRCGNGSNNPFSPVATAYTAGTCRITSAYGCTDNDGFNSLLFNGITMSQHSGCSVEAYRSFSNPVAPVVAGRTYAFSGSLLSSTWQEGIAIWLDMNRNNIFEATERVYNSGYTVTTAYGGNLTIPATVTPGPLRMRLVAAYSTIPTDPCGNYNYGEVEEYTLMVYANDVVQLTRLPDPTCPSVALPLSFGTTTPFAAGNVFTVELSDAAGTFGTPTSIGSVQAVGSSTLNVTIPANTAPGNGYQVRITSTNPASTTNPSAPIRVLSTCTCPTPTSLALNYTSASQVNLTWQCDATVSSFNLRWRVAGGTWNSLSGLTATEYFLRNLNTSNTYEWQVQAICLNNQVSDWSALGTFAPSTCGTATLGPASQQLTAGASATLSVGFSGLGAWSFGLLRNGVAVGSYSGIVTSPYTFTVEAPSSSTFTLGSASGSCGSLVRSGSAVVGVACGVPTNLTTTAVAVSSAQASWVGNATESYELRWRNTGTTPWTSATISPAATSGSYTFSGLVGSTQYEWQVRSVCGNEVASVFTASVLFTTLAPATCLTIVTTKSGLWTDPTVWSCGRIPGSGDIVQVQAGHVVTVPANTTALAGSLRNAGQVSLTAVGTYLRLGFDLNAGLTAYYPFSGNANDASGNNHHGAAVGATLTTDRFGVPANAYQFTGSGGWVAVPPHPDFHKNDFTLAVWMNAEAGSSTYKILLSYPANSGFENAWILYLDPALFALKGYMYTNIHMSAPVVWNDMLNNWRHVVFRKIGTQAELYIDGELRITYPVPANCSYASPIGLLMGGEDDDADGTPDHSWFKGKLDDVRVYNRPLNTLEIQALANDK
jgi:hypothetical protein